MPSRIVGSGSLVIVSAVVAGSTLIAALTTTEPVPVVPDRVYGPAFAGTRIDRPNGAPLYPSVRNTCPPVTRNGSAPGPVSTWVCPIRLSGPQVPCAACGSLQSVTAESSPNSPGGRCICNPLRNSSESVRPNATVNGVNAPAWLLVDPAANDGANCAAGQPVTSKLLVGVESGVNGVLHGVRSAEVVAVPHTRGFASVARAPPPSVSLSSLNGSCGLSL